MNHAEYIDLDKRIEDYDILGKKISESNLPWYDKHDLLEQIKERKNETMIYKTELHKTEPYEFAIV